MGSPASLQQLVDAASLVRVGERAESGFKAPKPIKADNKENGAPRKRGRELTETIAPPQPKQARTPELCGDPASSACLLVESSAASSVSHWSASIHTLSDDSHVRGYWQRLRILWGCTADTSLAAGTLLLRWARGGLCQPARLHHLTRALVHAASRQL